MSEFGHELKLASGLTLASLTAQSLNVYLALLTGLCGFIVILPKAIQTIRHTNWKKLFSRE